MIRTNRRKLALTSAVLAVVAMTASSLPAQAASDPGVTSTSIKLGITVPMTGIAAPGYNKIPGAMKAYFDYVNANGGVNGRKITLVIKDDQYIPTTAVAKANELILKDKVFALVGTLGTASTKAISASTQLAKRGIPSLFVNTGFSGFADKKAYPTTFSVLPSYYMEAKIMGKFLKDKYADKKIALIFQDDDFGRDALAGFKQAGVTFTTAIPYASGSQSLPATGAGWISKLKAAGTEVTVLFGVSSASTAALANAYAAGYKTQWVLGSVGGDATTIAASNKAYVPLLFGAKGFSFAPAPSDSSDEYIKLFQSIYASAQPTQTFDNNVVAGMSNAFLAVQAIKATGSNLTRAGLIKTIETKGASLASPFLTPLGYSATSHVGATGYWIGTYDQTGALKPDGGKYTVYTTDSGSGPVVESSFKRPAMPAKGLPN
ncbi:ABC-type branched-chain amino acid transport systems, periplasmic component [Candidatus Planktophila sulfonica]|uniref:ABC-type branched-chain amino acid transport systems, periplasmic component n=1 Tax=Candidatus Planktophila sulfonica TaxID=1884904 RepID=A0A249KHN6_9ACTN|nr:ABC transporter substrate-binding protein [Candidatus Planktophila sulfonica]ASY16320.1 ABC-type branched-chain amino acid transport systems, periplasmic component [Candidatus Planktophila sulfonica]